MKNLDELSIVELAEVFLQIQNSNGGEFCEDAENLVDILSDDYGRETAELIVYSSTAAKAWDIIIDKEMQGADLRGADLQGAYYNAGCKLVGCGSNKDKK